MRLLAIHSVELNLSAYLLLQGSSWPVIRKMGHDLTVRIIFMCGPNRLRSPTAEQAFSLRKDLKVESAGPNNDADDPHATELVAWPITPVKDGQMVGSPGPFKSEGS